MYDPELVSFLVDYAAFFKGKELEIVGKYYLRNYQTVQLVAFKA